MPNKQASLSCQKTVYQAKRCSETRYTALHGASPCLSVEVLLLQWRHSLPSHPCCRLPLLLLPRIPHSRRLLLPLLLQHLRNAVAAKVLPEVELLHMDVLLHPLAAAKVSRCKA
jgi:hypothetical protein